MVTVKDLNRKVQRAALHGAKIPHGLSNPVIRKENEKYYAAYFVYTYNRAQMEAKTYPRPSEWILCDIETGETAAVRECVEEDFSAQAADRLYSLADPSVKKPDSDHFAAMFALFDKVRESILAGGRFDEESYREYLDGILEITPEEYRVFYRELSI